MGTTRDDESQQSMWVATADLPQGAGHPFYERLNQVLNAAGFDAFVWQPPADRGAVGYCAAGENCWSDPSRTCARPAGCGGSIFEGILTPSAAAPTWTVRWRFS